MNNFDVNLFEVGPRDGLQSIKTQVPTETKVDLVNALSACGFKKIEVTSFVSPKWVPQLSDATEVMATIHRKPHVSYACLTPNLRGLQDALTQKADEVAIFAAASEGFSQANLNCSIEESLERFLPLIQAAKVENIPVRGYLSTVIACPYDGAVTPRQVYAVAQNLLDLGCYEVSLGDTIGAGNAPKIDALLDYLLDHIAPEKLAGHFHDTHKTAIEMIERCVQRGLRSFDSSIGGLGGCPYAPGASGNVDTRQVAQHLQSIGMNTGLNFDALEEAEKIALSIVSK